METFSSVDSGRKPSDETNPKRFCNGFVLGLMAESTGRYRITSNREETQDEHGSSGHCVVMLEPLKDGDPAFVLEFKVHDPENEAALKDIIKAVLEQIEEKAYDTELTSRGITTKNAPQIRYHSSIVNTTVNLHPPSGTFSTDISPPETFRICFTSASPSPLPSSLWELSL